MSEPFWYAVQTKPRQEDRVRHWLLGRSQIPVFLPKLEEVRKRRAQRVTVVEPLFPSYLFVRIPMDPEPWHAVRWAPGVKRIVGTDEIPTPVPADVMRMLMERCGDTDVVYRSPAFRGGEAVRVVHGPFAGLQGVLERPASRGERVRVLLQLLRCTTPVEMDITDIEAVSVHGAGFAG